MSRVRSVYVFATPSDSPRAPAGPTLFFAMWETMTQQTMPRLSCWSVTFCAIALPKATAPRSPIAHFAAWSKTSDRFATRAFASSSAPCVSSWFPAISFILRLLVQRYSADSDLFASKDSASAFAPGGSMLFLAIQTT